MQSPTPRIRRSLLLCPYRVELISSKKNAYHFDKHLISESWQGRLWSHLTHTPLYQIIFPRRFTLLLVQCH